MRKVKSAVPPLPKKDRALNTKDLESSNTSNDTVLRTNLEWALEYATKGWHIFPVHYVLKDGSCSCKDGLECDRLGKHPATKNGVLDATTEPEQIKRWWAMRPHYNIGLATGHAGLQVVDIDIDGDKIGAESLANRIEQYGDLPETLSQRTGSGGTHYFFHSDTPYTNSQDKIGKHIDSRGKGGYVILPPSNHKSGGHYEWISPDAAIAELPAWIGALLTADRPTKKARKGKIDATEDSEQKFAEDDLKGKSLSKQDVVKLLAVIPADDRDTWWKVGAAIKNEWGDDGFDIWDEWSRTDAAKYKAQDQQRQWRSFKEDQITLGTIVHFAKENGWRGFDKEAADVPEIKENWIFVVGIKRFIELNTMQELDQEQFSCQFAPLFKRGRASEHTLRNEAFPRVDGVTYWPDKNQIVEEEGLSKLNLWRPSGVTAEPGDVTMFLDHIAYLFPDEKEQEIVLDYMAFQVQKPGQKVHWALLVQGEQGNGKSYIGYVMKCVLGNHNVRNVNSHSLHEDFTGWQKNTQFVIVEEMMAKGRLELMNKLKPMITEPWCSIREMYKPAYEQPNRFNFLFLTNHDDAISIDKTDRRYCVLRSLAPPHPKGIKGYYVPLFNWTKDSAPALLAFLQSRDLRDFVPQAHAPMTDAKQDLIAESMPPLDSWIRGQVEAEAWPFNVDLISPGELAGCLFEFNLRANPKEVGRALNRLGYKFLGARRLSSEPDRSGKPKPIPVYAIRNIPTYEAMTPDQLRCVWSSQTGLEQPGSAAEPTHEEVVMSHRRQSVVNQTRKLNVVKETKPM